MVPARMTAKNPKQIVRATVMFLNYYFFPEENKYFPLKENKYFKPGGKDKIFSCRER
jgi:hypothetical protein